MTWRALPVGTQPAALGVPHFPTRQQAVVWRNWELVPVERLAKVLRTSRANVLGMARDMGLRVPPVVEPLWLQRGYCTLLRSNWHLLPYPQILELLGWSAARLEQALREEDALWIKLGMLKPRVAPVRYAPLTRAQQRQTEALKAVVNRHFPDITDPCDADPPFMFLKRFSQPVQAAKRPPVRRAEGLRLLYSYVAPYGDALLQPELDPYPDVLLDRLADCGVNAVWLPVLLYQVAPVGGLFDPVLSKGHATRLANLRHLAQRVARRGLGLYLYLNEPHALPTGSPVFARHPEWRGVAYDEWGVTSLCTANPAVIDMVRAGAAQVFRAVPELAGVFSINMSEFPTHCYARGRGHECPRCATRPVPEVVAEVIDAIEEGVHSAKADARVIVWDWAWKPEWAHELVDRLPRRVELMCVSEWGLPLRSSDGREHTLSDYSISRVGPSRRSLALWRHARRRGVNVVAKVQLNSSWELSTVPYLPVADLVERHLRNLHRAGVKDLVLSWTVGGYPGGNLALLDSTSAALAVKTFGPRAAVHVRAAWRRFSHAFTRFPFSLPTIYDGPHNAGPMNLLHRQSTGYAASMVQGFPYDDLKQWRDFYTEAEFERRFGELSEGWSRGLAELERARPFVSVAGVVAFDELERMALAAYYHFRSTWLQIKFVRRRGRRSESARRELAVILAEEAELAKRLCALVRADSRIGFEAANHYAYSINDLREKVLSCEWLRQGLVGVADHA